MGKGSKRRPTLIADSVLEANWDCIFISQGRDYSVIDKIKKTKNGLSYPENFFNGDTTEFKK